MKGTIKGIIVYVVDGDTVDFKALNNKIIRIRLKGIDAPEKGQALGQKAKRVLEKMVLGNKVTAKTYGQDRYGRTVAILIVDGMSVNAQLVEMGLAYNYEDRGGYAAQEAKAKKARRGVHKSKTSVRPKEFRKWL